MELNGLPEGSRPTRVQRRFSDLPQREGQRKNLRDALDREWNVAVAADDDVVVGVDHGNAELPRVDARKLGDIRCDGAPIGDLPHFADNLFDRHLELGHWPVHHAIAPPPF